MRMELDSHSVGELNGNRLNQTEQNVRQSCSCIHYGTEHVLINNFILLYNKYYRLKRVPTRFERAFSPGDSRRLFSRRDFFSISYEFDLDILTREKWIRYSTVYNNRLQGCRFTDNSEKCQDVRLVLYYYYYYYVRNSTY